MLKGVIVTITIAAFFGGVAIGTFDKSDSGLTSDELNEILSAIESRAAPAPQPAQRTAQPSTPQIFKVFIDDDPVKGNPNAPVTVVEFSDFQCPFCSRFFQQTLPLLEENYIDTGKIKFVYKDLPLDSLHPNARATHIAAECADEQDKFWEYHDVLFQSQAEWQSLASSNLQSTLSQYATDLDLQVASFESCMQSQDISNEVNKDILEAARYGATGTPTFFIGNENDGFIKLIGAQPFSVFKNIIDSQLG
nr:Disulfide bond formation protein D [Chlamydiota bacterium]